MCSICMEEVLLPTEVICFGCYRPNELGCSSIHRTCLRCAYRWLQLDRDADQRDYFRKCLYCPQHALLQTLDTATALRKDFMIMLADEQATHSCPFCDAYKGTQMAIHRHLEQDCGRFPVQCPCRRVLARDDFYFHLFTCTHHKYCYDCRLYIKRPLYGQHLKDVHDQIQCKSCGKYVHFDMYGHHVDAECPDRMMVCTCCMKIVPYRQYRPHLMEHMSEVVQEIKTIRSRYNELSALFKKIQDLLAPSWSTNLLEQNSHDDPNTLLPPISINTPTPSSFTSS